MVRVTRSYEDLQRGTLVRVLPHSYDHRTQKVTVTVPALAGTRQGCLRAVPMVCLSCIPPHISR